MGKTETNQEKVSDADNTIKRSSQNSKLTEEEQSRNRMLSQTRAEVEDVS